MFNNREEGLAQLTDLPTEIYTTAIPSAGISVNQTIATMRSLSSTCTQFNKRFLDPLSEIALRILLQAVIDGDTKTVKRILDSKPALLLETLPKGWIVQSKLTWPNYDLENENALSIAAKRKQIEMIALMQPYYDKLAEQDTINAEKAKKAISAWECYKTIKNAEGKDEIDIPQEYITYLESLVEVISKEKFPYGLLSKDNNMLSDESEFALSTLLNILIPKKAVKLDDYLDIELFLLAAYKVYLAKRKMNGDQCDAFCIRAIGLIQSALLSQPAKIFCTGLDDVVTEIGKGKNITDVSISEAALQYKLKGGESFYRPSRDSRTGLGFDFLCGIFGWHGVVGLRLRPCWKNYVEQKQVLFGKLRSDCSLSKTSTNSM